MLSFLKRIWEWLSGLFARRGGSHDFYRPGQRLIYRYWDGEKVITADPMVLYRRVSDVGPELSVDIRVTNSISKGAGKAYTNVLKKVREIFSVKSLEEGGLSETETLELLDHFLGYCDGVKKNSRSTLTTATETSAPSAPSSAESPPTTNTSASGSTGGEPFTAGPALTPSEPASPTAP